MLLHTPKPDLGTTAPTFNLPATDGRSYRLDDFTGTALVVVFTCNHCPYAQAVWPRLGAIAREYLPRGVNFVAINPNDDTGYPRIVFSRCNKKLESGG